MARTAITPIDLTKTGYNLTDSTDLTTLSIGDGNGITVAFDPNDFLVLKNDTGGSAVFTLKVPGEDKAREARADAEEVAARAGEAIRTQKVVSGK